MVPKHLDERCAAAFDHLGVKLTKLRPTRPTTSACHSTAPTAGALSVTDAKRRMRIWIQMSF